MFARRGLTMRYAGRIWTVSRVLSRTIRVGIWVGVNGLILFGLPRLYGRWLWHEVQEEYRLGLRVSTGADSIGIPISGFTVLLAALLLVSNVGLWLWWTIRRRAGRAA